MERIGRGRVRRNSMIAICDVSAYYEPLRVDGAALLPKGFAKTTMHCADSCKSSRKRRRLLRWDS